MDYIFYELICLHQSLMGKKHTPDSLDQTILLADHEIFGRTPVVLCGKTLTVGTNHCIPSTPQETYFGNSMTQSSSHHNFAFLALCLPIFLVSTINFENCFAAYDDPHLDRCHCNNIKQGVPEGSVLCPPISSACLVDISSWMIADQLKLNPIRIKTLVLAYKAKNEPTPSYLKALITTRIAVCSLRSSSTAWLIYPHGQNCWCTSNKERITLNGHWNNLNSNVKVLRCLIAPCCLSQSGSMEDDRGELLKAIHKNMRLEFDKMHTDKPQSFWENVICTDVTCNKVVVCLISSMFSRVSWICAL